MENDLAYIVGLFETNNGLVKKAIEGIPPERWVERPNDSSNHMLWIVGHLVWCRGNILKTLGAEGVPLPWGSLFGRGAQLTTQDQYPSVEEIRTTWDAVSERLINTLPKVAPEVLATPHDKPTLDGKTGGYIAFLGCHEAYHAGQLSYLRKWLEHGQVAG